MCKKKKDGGCYRQKREEIRGKKSETAQNFLKTFNKYLLMKVHGKLDSNFNSGNEPRDRRPKSPPEWAGTLAMNTVVLQITIDDADTQKQVS